MAGGARPGHDQHGPPGAILLTLAAGWFIGSLVLVLFGSPLRRPTPDDITDALARSACPVESLDPVAVGATGSTPYVANVGDGRRLSVKVLSDEERSADLLSRLYRWARFRNLGDERPFSSLKQEVEHEALCALGARDVGVRTPRMVVVSTVGSVRRLHAPRLRGCSTAPHWTACLPSSSPTTCSRASGDRSA